MISRTIKDAQINQKELLVAKNIKQHQEIHLKIPKMSVEQSTTYEESERTSSIEDTLRTMAGNQY